MTHFHTKFHDCAWKYARVADTSLLKARFECADKSEDSVCAVVNIENVDPYVCREHFTDHSGIKLKWVRPNPEEEIQSAQKW